MSVPALSDEEYEPVLRPDGSYRLGLPCCSIKAENHLRCITPDCDCSCHSGPSSPETGSKR